MIFRSTIHQSCSYLLTVYHMMPIQDTEACSDGTATSPANVDLHISIAARMSRFTWPWFACTMSTGSIAVVMAQQPFTFDGLRTIGKTFFILDLVLFLAFSTCISIRFIKDPSAFGHSLHHPQESFFFGTWWVSLALILNCMQAYAVPVCGPWLIATLGVLFWMYAGCALLVAIFQYHLIFEKESLSADEALPAWILPSRSLTSSANLCQAEMPASLPISGTRPTRRSPGERSASRSCLADPYRRSPVPRIGMALRIYDIHYLSRQTDQ